MNPVEAGAGPEGDGAAFDVVVYPASWRLAAAVLKVVARGSLLVTAGLFLFSDQPPSNPLKQMRLFLGLFAAPELAAWCIARSLAGRASLVGDTLVLEQRDRRVEVPVEAIQAVEVWKLPLPRGGVNVRLGSGKRYPEGLAVADPASLVEALVAAGGDPSLRRGLELPMAVYARARVASPPRFLDHPVFKFVVFSLLPAVPAYRLHQYITFGGAFGEYYTFGLQAYLLGFALWWVSWALGLLVSAAALRAAVEVLALGTAFVAPGWAVAGRRVLEWVQRGLYYTPIPVYLLLWAWRE